ncbi:MAG: MATE family efflux transporter [Clostridiales bacterium]|nr:MATE family efflux transporter [Clostridiales bacterium]
MKQNLDSKNINRLLWQLSIPAILGMLSSAIFNIVDRIFVGKISPDALTAVGITMPIQVLQMAFVLLIGIGSSALVSIKLGEENKEDAESILYLAYKYIIVFLIAFAILFMLFREPILHLLAIPDTVMPYAKAYIGIIIVGSITGIPGYCLNNSLRAIGQAKTSMTIIIATSILNMILDPIFIFAFRMGIAGAALATVISQTTLTIYVVWAFKKRSDFPIQLKAKKVKNALELTKSGFKMGLPSFLVQLLATAVNMFLNYSLLRLGTDLDIASVTIMSSIFSFYHMVIVGLVQGNNTICGFNLGAKHYDRIRKALKLALLYAFCISMALYLVIMLAPQFLVGLFTDEAALITSTSKGIRIYLGMLPLVGLQTVSSQYFQSVGMARRSSVLSFLRYGIFVVPAVLILAPYGVTGIYISNALSDALASITAILCIIVELKRLKKMEGLHG